jgi:hypothetical protein
MNLFRNLILFISIFYFGCSEYKTLDKIDQNNIQEEYRMEVFFDKNVFKMAHVFSINFQNLKMYFKVFRTSEIFNSLLNYLLPQNLISHEKCELITLFFFSFSRFLFKIFFEICINKKFEKF